MPSLRRDWWVAFALLVVALIGGCAAPWDPVRGLGPCSVSCSPEVVHVYPHDPGAFTEGLFLHEGKLYESTGLEGESSLRRIALAQGTIEQQRLMNPAEFGEGLALAGEHIVQLTWKHHKAYVYDKSTFEQVDTFGYPTEGWGLAFDGKRYVMSDGSSTLYFRSVQDFSELGRIQVHDAQGFVSNLNEIECIDGLIYANVWYTEMILIIDPVDGAVRGRIGLSNLLPQEDRTAQTNVLNGIAYDPASGHLLVTGKRWPKLFEVSLKEIE